MYFVKVFIPSAVGGDHRPWVADVNPHYSGSVDCSLIFRALLIDLLLLGKKINR
jgi:hypothetical protein